MLQCTLCMIWMLILFVFSMYQNKKWVNTLWHTRDVELTYFVEAMNLGYKCIFFAPWHVIDAAELWFLEWSVKHEMVFVVWNWTVPYLAVVKSILRDNCAIQQISTPATQNVKNHPKCGCNLVKLVPFAVLIQCQNDTKSS